MKKAGSTSEVNLIAQFSRGIRNRPTKRYYLTKETKGGTLGRDVVEDLGNTNAANPRAFDDFLRWGVERFPAKRYLLVIWGHANGVDDEAVPNAISTAHIEASQDSNLTKSKGVLIGPSSTALEGPAVDFLDCQSFAKALESATKLLGRKIDLLGMDACLMSMAEVWYQVRKSVRLTAASEGSGPLDGWPYDRILSKLVKNPEIKPEELAEVIVENYVASYADYEDASITQSICDLNKCEALTHAVKGLAEALLNNLADDEIKKAIMFARLQTQTYSMTDEYVDLYDFCDLLQRGCKNARIKAACRNVNNTIHRDKFVLKSVYRGNEAQYSYGVSIYFPLADVSSFYGRLDFAKDARWLEFLLEYVMKTRRPDRVN
jgi:hypothetical protein